MPAEFRNTPVVEFRNTPVVFSGGVDKSDQYLVSPRKATLLENCVFDTAQTIMQRNGQLLLSLAPAVATIPAPLTRTNPSYSGVPYRLAQNQGSLLIEGVNGLFSREAYNGITGQYADSPSMLQVRSDAAPFAVPGRSDFVRASVETNYVGTVRTISDDIQFKSYDFGRIENYDGNGRVCTLWAWVEASDASGSQQLHVRAFDEGVNAVTAAALGAPVDRVQLLDQVITGTAAFARVVASSTDFYVATHDGANLEISFRYAPGTGTVSFPTYSVACDFPYDILIDPTDGQVVVAHNNNAANALRIAKLNAAASAESFGNTFTITGTLESVSLVLTRISSLYRYTALYYCSATRTLLRGVSLTSAAGTTVETTIATHGAVLGRLTGVDNGDNTSSTFTVFWDSSKTLVAVGSSQVIGQVTVDKATLAPTVAPYAVVEMAHIYGRPVVQGTSILLPCAYLLDADYPSIFVAKALVDTALYPTYTLNTAATALFAARVHWGSAGNIANDWDNQAPIVHTYVDSSGDVSFPAERWGAQAVSTNGQIKAPSQIWQARLSLTTQDIGYAESNQVTFLAGSCPQAYDGSFFEEAGFNHRPVIISAVASGVGNLSTGSYTVYATYVHVDQRGNISESMPSAPVVFSATSGNGYTPTVLACGLTAKRGVSTRIYRTIANGAVAYLDIADANEFATGRSDVDITANTVIPTDGGVLPNEPMPACRVAVEHQNRIWCAGGEAGDLVYFSQPISENILPEFNRQLVRRIPKAAGRVVNIVSLDDKLVVFCEKRVGFIYGEGPTRTGAQDGYSEFIEAVSGYTIPWDEPHSIIRSTDGVWFRCGFGFRLLGRNMAIVQDGIGDLGSEIDAALISEDGLTYYKVIRALIGSSGQQVRFYTNGGFVFVFDLVYKQWSTFTNFSCVDSTAIGEDFYHINTTPQLLVQTRYARSDNGTTITSALNTAWLAFAGLQAFMRVSRIQLLGRAVTDVSGSVWNVVVAAQYNYVSTNSETFTTIYSGPFLQAGTGSQSRQIEMQPATQKCESMRLRITFSQTAPGSAGYQEPLRITGINLRTAIKKGRFKLATANKV